MATLVPQLPDPHATLDEFLSAVKGFSENSAFKNAENFVGSIKQLTDKVKAQDETMMATRSELVRTKQELERSSGLWLRAHREETSKITNEKDELQAEHDRFRVELAQEKSRCHDLNEDLKNLRHQLGEEKKQTKSLQDQIGHLKETKSKLGDDVVKANENVRVRNNEIRELKTKIKEQDKVRSELSDKNTGLETKLRDQGVVIKQIHNFAPSSVKDDTTYISQSLNNLWQACFQAVTQCFDTDIDVAVLENQTSWKALKESEAIPPDVPFPPSNATAAKRIRTAAVMAVLADALTEYIFTPSYLLFDDEELRNISFHLAATDSDRGRFLRRVLNGTSKDKQAAVEERRMDSVLEQVNACVQSLLVEKVQESFTANLSQLLGEAIELWSSVQCMASFFDTDIAVDPKGQWKWLAVSWAEQSNALNEREIDSEHPRDLDACLVLFPRVFIVTDSVDRPVFPGMVLPQAEFRAARDEWDKIRQSNPMLGRSPNSKSMRPRRMTLNQANGAKPPFLD